MTQFLAILKDSFREAVDGFVIYAMLGMSLLVIVIVGSMSYTPAEPQDAFTKIVSSREFTRIFQDRGRSRSFNQISFDSKLAASDVQPSGSGYKLRVTVTAKPLAVVAEKKGEKAFGLIRQENKIVMPSAFSPIVSPRRENRRRPSSR